LTPGGDHKFLESGTLEHLDQGGTPRFQLPAGHGQDIAGDDPSLGVYPGHGIPTPGSRGGAQVEHDRASPQQALAPNGYCSGNDRSWIMPAMALTEKQLRFLRGKAHPLRPVVMLGNKGLTDNVVAESAQALRDHELIKVRVRAADRAQRDALLAQLVARTESTLVVRIGHVAVLYRAATPLPRLVLPDAQV
jgi:RNA-binding protein